MEEKIEHFSTLPDYLLTMSQATRALGFKDYRVMEVMCEGGFIKPLKVAGSKRLRFRYQDVMKLATPIPHSTKRKKSRTKKI